MTDSVPDAPDTVGRPRLSADFLFRPVDGASLAAIRVFFGVLLFVGIARFVLEGWIEVLFVEPRHFLKYSGFEWVWVWSRPGMYAHYVVLAALAAAIAVGYRTRTAALLFFLSFTYVELMDVTNYLNHYYLVSLIALLLVVVPANRVWSIDAQQRGGAPAMTVPAWCVYLLRFQVGVVYVYAGLAKFGSDWLLHAQPLGLWLAARDETPLLGPWFATDWLPYAMSWGGFFFDTTIVFFLLWRWTRPVAFAVLLLFHGMTHVLFDIGLFPFLMTALATIFFAPDWPRTLLRRIGVGVAAADTATATPQWGWTPLRVLGATALGAHCLVQAALPLRHHYYPGSVLWHEQGMRWSWNVMVREKSGSITYHARDPESGRTWQITPQRYLTWRQANEMSGQPDLILQVAHLVADELRSLGVVDPEVRAEALVSLNGRPPSPLIDPEVNLADVRDGLGRATWILPEPTDPPHAVLARADTLP